MRIAIIGAGNVAGPSERPGRKKPATRFSSGSGIQRLTKRKLWCGGLAGWLKPAHLHKRRHSPNSSC